MKNHLLAGQRRFYECDAERKLFLGGRRSGKTHALGAEGVEAAVEDGDDVLLFSPNQRMADGAIDEARTIAFDHYNQMSLKTNTKHKLVFNSGGEISVSTYHQLGRGRVSVNNYDLLLFDEIQEIDVDDLQNLYEYQYNTSQMPTNPYPIKGFYAAATPPFTDPLEYLKEKDFAFIPVSTIENSMVDPEFIKEERERLDESTFRSRYMVGVNVGDHMLYDTEQDGERVHECMLCDFKETIPLDFPDENVAAAEAYVFGKAYDTACG